MIIVTTTSLAERMWIPRLSGVRCVHTRMGEGAATLSRSLQRVVDGPIAIVGSGFCGGLSSEAQAGTVIVADAISYRGEKIAIDQALVECARRALIAANLPFLVGRIVTSQKVAKSTEEKEKLARTGAIAVDMESGILSRAAHDKGIAFLPLRVVLDTREEPLAFNADRLDVVRALAHPIATLHLLKTVIVAGRTIGRAIVAVTNELLPRREECVA